MRWPWQRATRTSASAQPRLLPSATLGISFEAIYTIIWRPRWRTHPNWKEVVRSHVHTTAAQTAAYLDATDLPAAQDAVNAALSQFAPHPHYRLLSAHAALRLSDAAQELLAQRQADEHRIRRLRFLKENLYDRPDLVVLERLEHLAPRALDDEHVAELQHLARLISSCDRWWFPLLQQWEQVGRGFKDAGMQQQAMLVLHDSLKALNGGSLPEDDASLDSDVPNATPRRAHP
jgi:Arc/MetJ family transcription regulator